jgi:hypothetical protein
LVREDKIGGACGKSGEGKNCLQGLGRKYEEKRTFVKGRHKWENDIKMGLSHVEKEDIEEGGYRGGRI